MSILVRGVGSGLSSIAAPMRAVQQRSAHNSGSRAQLSCPDTRKLDQQYEKLVQQP